MNRLNLERLVINISHDCNLRCKYCYADSGSYKGSRGLLSLDKGKQIVDYFFFLFTKIELIQFFGGEPLLNYRVIEPLCKYISKICKQKNIETPIFGLVTNGTILNNTIIKIIQEYSIRVTVSLDGFASINDSLRVYRNGAGSFKRINSNIHKMKKETGQPVQIEGTLTSEHLRRKFSFVEFIDYVVQELGIHSIHMPWIIGNCYDGYGIAPSNRNIERVIRIYSEAIQKSLRSMITPEINEMFLITYVERYLEHYLKKTFNGPYMCPAGNSTLAVSIDGTIYPCFMFINNKKFNLGQINKTSMMKLIKKISQFSKELEAPSKSFNKINIPLMFCAGACYERNGSLNQVSAYEEVIFKKLNAYLKKELKHLLKDQKTRDWVKTKLMLYNLLLDIRT